MYNAILISTEHRESGNCNSDELYKIVESINPDVIFEEEINDDKYQSYYSEKDSFKSLEVQTIIKYRQNHDIIHIPVDTKINQYLSFNEWDLLFNIFNQYHVYKQMTKKHCSLRNKYGFAYLNSEKCSELFEKMKFTEEQLLTFSGLEKNNLNRIYNLFHKEHDVRENAMLLNIYKFSKENQYTQAVFFLGYAHRKSMEKKILEYNSKDNFKINWSFYNEIY